MYIHIYIYIYRERERERDVWICLICINREPRQGPHACVPVCTPRGTSTHRTDPRVSLCNECSSQGRMNQQVNGQTAAYTRGSFLIPCQRGHPGVVLPLVMSKSANT